MSSAIEDFCETVDRIYGAYLDANAGFHALRTNIEQTQAYSVTLLKIPADKLDERLFFYGAGDPNDPKSVVLHKNTQGQLKNRNRKNGENSLFLGAMCLVAIYQFWEDRFRSEIAAELSIKTKLEHDILGDIRLIRNSIIHHERIAKDEISRCKCLQWFKPGDAIAIDEERMDQIVLQLRNACNEWLAARGKIRKST